MMEWLPYNIIITSGRNLIIIMRSNDTIKSSYTILWLYLNCPNDLTKWQSQNFHQNMEVISYKAMMSMWRAFRLEKMSSPAVINFPPIFKKFALDNKMALNIMIYSRYICCKSRIWTLKTSSFIHSFIIFIFLLFKGALVAAQVYLV